MNKTKLIDALNKDRADELAAIMQYMTHHYVADGLDGISVAGIFKSTAKDEMKHAELLAERIVYLGGEPTQKPSIIKKGGNLTKMIRDDLNSENMAIKAYREHIKLADKEDDPTTRTMLEGILADEEKHAETWRTALAGKK